jgi:hypothetical protein
MAQWYYSKGEQQIGPVSDVEIRDLVARGTLTPNDDVWREGMADWQRAADIREPFAERPVAPPPAPNPGARRAASANPLSSNLAAVDLPRLLRPFGYWLLFSGLMLVVIAKGCDSMASRYAARAKAKAVQAPLDFTYSYDTRRLRLETERDEINEKPQISESDRDRLDEIDTELDALKTKMEKDRRYYTRTSWRSLQYNADSAEASARMWGYWREVLFVFGSLVLSAGLLVVGLTGDAPQRWLCLAMLAIIVFSLFIGGYAWAAALVR